MRAIATILLTGSCLVAVLTAAGCGDTTEGTGSTTTTPPTQEQTEPAPAPEQTEPAPAPDASSGQQWVMPDLVGSTLQDAQDQVQAMTDQAVFFTDSHDLSGEDRNQVLDANWTVCTQNVQAGAPLTSASRIDFGVVKTEEGCP